MESKKSISISIKLDVLKGSVNRMLIPMRGLTKTGHKRLIYGPSFREAKNRVKSYLYENYKGLENSFGDHPEFYFLDVEYVAYGDWLTKSSKYRKLRKKDVANYQKNIEDVVCTFLGVDDQYIRKSSIEKGLIEGEQTAAQIHVTVSLYEIDIRAFKRL
jgi:hypothetical protein